MTTAPLRHAAPLRHVASVASSSVDKKSHDHEIPVRLCNYTDVYRNDEVRPGDHLMSATATAEEIDRFRLAIGDTVITKDSENPTDIGIAAFIPEAADDFVCAYHLAVIRPNRIDPKFLFWSMRGRRALDHMSVGANGMTRFGLGLDTIKTVPVCDLPISEQRRIAEFLDDRVARIDNIVAARRLQIVTTNQRRASAVRDAVLGLDGTTTKRTNLLWATDVAANRTVRRLSQLARMGTGHTPSRSVPEYWLDCDVPWLTTADVHKFRYDQIDELASTEASISELGLANSAAVLHPKGTVALSRTASAGFAVVMGQPMATSQDYVTWTCGADLRPHFLLATLRVMRPYLLGCLSIGSTHKTIYFPDLGSIRIPVPDLDDQDRALELIRAIDEGTRRVGAGLEQSIALLAEYKQSLITAAVTGELDVTTASREVPA